MARLLTDADGRLRTGRVTLLVFIGLLGAMSILFKLNRSVDHAVLAVKHVFEPAAVQSVEERFDTSGNAARRRTTERESEAGQGPPEKRETGNDGGKEAPKSVETHEFEGRPAALKPPPEKTEAVTPEAGPPHPEGPSASGDTENALSVVKKEPARDDHLHPHDPGDKVSPEASGGAEPEKRARIGPEESPQRVKPVSEKIDVSENLGRLISRTDTGVRKHEFLSRQASSAAPESGRVRTDPHTGEVTVDQNQYKTLFQGWRDSGNGAKGQGKIPLRVENLRHCYALFQMKVIAVVRENIFLDLTDGTRVAEASLTEYSSTLFRVDRPWDKWGEALSEAGIRRGERVEVRYYMYDFIKKAIYARVNQAFSWCKEHGLIAGDLPETEVDVLGRAYVINRQGGGRFAVFVPVSLDTRNGRSIAIDPVCFSGQADMEALQGAGVL